MGCIWISERTYNQRKGVGPVTLFHKYCFPNLHWIHAKALEVEDCEFGPVHHQQMWAKQNTFLEQSGYDQAIGMYLVSFATVQYVVLNSCSLLTRCPIQWDLLARRWLEWAGHLINAIQKELLAKMIEF